MKEDLDMVNAAEIDADRVYIANEDGPIQLDRGNSNQSGVIYTANSARFIESNFSEPLTAYAVGWKDPNNIEQTLEFIAPKVPTSRRFEYAEWVNAEEFLSETDDLRAIGSDFKRVEFKSIKSTSKTLNKGLTIRVDLDNYTMLPNWREVLTGKLMRRLFRNEYRRAFTLLSAAATNTGKTWNGTSGEDADQDVMGKIVTFGDTAGVSPNRVLYGQSAWVARRKSHRAQNTAGGFASAALSLEELADQLAVDECYVSKERYSSSSSARTQIVNLLVEIFLAESGATPEDPSNIKRFVSPTEGGTPFRVYEQQISSKLVDISVEHYSNIVITSTLGIQQLTITA